MAIEILVGLQGSGKSYYGTWRIQEEIRNMYFAEVEGKSYKYKRIYTNIEGIRENKYVKPLKFKDLHDFYTWELKQYLRWESKGEEVELPEIEFKEEQKKTKTRKKNDDVEHIKATDTIVEHSADIDRILKHIDEGSKSYKDYIDYIKPYVEAKKYNDCLFVIDEAHNHLQTMSGAKKRLASYHRHYGQDFLLITQDLKQLPRYITNITIKTIKAGSPALKIGKTFVYDIYSGGYIAYSNVNRLEIKKLRFDPDVAKLYISGDIKSYKSYFLKYIIIIVLILLSIFLTFQLVFKMLESKEKKEKVIKKETVVQKEIKPVHDAAGRPVTQKEKTEIFDFYMIGDVLIVANKKYKFNRFKRILSAGDELISRDITQDGTFILTYSLTIATQKKFDLYKKKEKENSEKATLSNPFK